MTDTRVSVAMCTCNGTRYIREQLRSIQLQKRLPDELIIVDDASQDDTMQSLTQFAAGSAFPVRLLANPERLGAARNFAKAIEACQGDIIILADQDDVWRPQKVESLVAALNKHPEAVYAFSDAAMIDSLGKPLGQTLWKSVGLEDRLAKFSGAGQVEMLLRHNLIPGASLAFRSSFRPFILPLPAGWMHDYWIVLLGAVMACGVPVGEILFDYRLHSDQVCGWRKKTFGQVIRDSLIAGKKESEEKVDIFRALELRVLSAGKRNLSDRVRLVKEKELHLVRRARVRSLNGVSRIKEVVMEAGTGRYQRFSNSWLSVIRDL